MAEMKKSHGPESIPEATEFELIGLEAENIKALKAVRLGLKGKSLVVIGGNNAQGKTSLLDCVAIALGGKKEEPEEVIRRGETHGKIVLDLDECDAPDHIPAAGRDPIGLKVTVVFTKKAGRKLVLEGKDGFPFHSPQEIFDTFVSRLTFDPLDFIRMDKDKQVGIIRQMAGIDFTELDQKFNSLYEQRRDLNRDLKNTGGALASSSNLDLEIYEKPIDVPALIAERDKIQESNAKNNDRMRKLGELAKNILGKVGEVDALARDLEVLKNKLEIARAELEAMNEQHADWTERAKALVWTKTDEIDQQIAQAQEINALVEKKKFRNEQLASIDKIKKQVEAIEEQMEHVKLDKDYMITNAKYPVPGFRISSDGMLLYNDLPFSQASGMQQIDVAIDMALAINPRLKLALVREGSIIDLDNLKRIQQRVEAKGGKLIMERTGKTAEMSVIIEDGEIIENRMG